MVMNNEFFEGTCFIKTQMKPGDKEQGKDWKVG